MIIPLVRLIDISPNCRNYLFLSNTSGFNVVILWLNVLLQGNKIKECYPSNLQVITSLPPYIYTVEPNNNFCDPQINEFHQDHMMTARSYILQSIRKVN